LLSSFSRFFIVVFSSLLFASVVVAEEQSTKNFLGTDSDLYEKMWREQGHQGVNKIAGDQPSAFLGFSPSLSVSNSRFPNAYIRPNGKIVLTVGMLALVESQSELAFIIAHEIGHLLLEHHQGKGEQQNDKNSEALELEADLFALKALTSAGLETSAGIDLLLRIAAFGEKQSLGTLYPTLFKRAELLRRHLGA